MSPLTLFWFLLGDSAAIEAVAVDPWAPWVGLALAATTGLARHYDNKDLLRQPWFLVLPAAAALALASVMFGVLCLVLLLKGRSPPAFLPGWWSLLGLFLCTAPFAWVYAIPYQRFLSLGGTVRAKLTTLGVVATARVLLMSRVVTVLLNDRTPGSLFFVLMVADAVALVALWVTSIPNTAQSTPQVFTGMGGIGPQIADKKQDQFATGVAVGVGCIGVVLMPLWVAGVCVAPLSAAHWQGLLAGATPVAPPAPVMWALPAVALLGFLGLALRTQPAQWRRSRVEQRLRSGRVEEALAELSALGPAVFPPHWQPPPVANFREPPTLLTAVRAVLDTQPAEWVRSLYLTRFEAYLAEPLWYWLYDDDLEQVVAILWRLPDARERAAKVLDAGLKFDERNVRFRKQWGLTKDPADKSNPAPMPEPNSFPIFGVIPEPVPTDRRPEILAALADLAGKNGDEKREPE
jgi:hypothetical protein